VLSYTAKVISDILYRNYFYIVAGGIALREVLNIYRALVELYIKLLAKPLVELRAEF
jgi:hypothetical protein